MKFILKVCSFINIFIDVDIQDIAYIQYQGIGIPFNVFLNSDGSLYYQYAGTLYGDDFLDVLKEIKRGTNSGSELLSSENSKNDLSFEPSYSLSIDKLEDLKSIFYKGLIENFDPKEYGLGRGKKEILPKAFLYLLETSINDNRADGVDRLVETMERAIGTIYDPIDGGFFRYAETREWLIPHYEKFSGLNAGTALLLYRLNEIGQSQRLLTAAEQTLAYMMTKLFDDKLGCYLNFQVADTKYYSFGKDQRQQASTPKVMERIFLDQLSITLSYLIEVREYLDDKKLDHSIVQSLNFLENMLAEEENIPRYYSMSDKRWYGTAGLSDHAHLAHTFFKAGMNFNKPQYTDIAYSLLGRSISEFYDLDRGVFIEPVLGKHENIEYLMAINSLLVQVMTGFNDSLADQERDMIDRIITYYSSIGHLLEERLWDAHEWGFVEYYATYLSAVDEFIQP